MLPQAAFYAAEPLVLTGPADTKALGAHFEYSLDADWSLKPVNFVGADAVPTKPLPGGVSDFGYTSSKIWLKLPVRNQTADQTDWRFFVHANFTQTFSIHQIAPDGLIKTLMDLGQDSPFSARPVNYPQMVVPLKLAPEQAATLACAAKLSGVSIDMESREEPCE